MPNNEYNNENLNIKKFHVKETSHNCNTFLCKIRIS